MIINPRKFGAILTLVAVALFASESNAQIFKRRSSCPPGGCPQTTQVYSHTTYSQQTYNQPVQSIPVAPIVVKTSEDIPVETSAVKATTPHVRCIYNGSCGSGTICGADQGGSYVLTNAHVVGTSLGRIATVDLVSDSGTKRVRGRLVMSGYSDRTMVDFAILYCEGLTSERYMPLLKTEPADAPYSTTGSPRCIWPQVLKKFNDPRNYGQGLITGTPDAIGGQSGSAIYNSKGQQIALLTWSIGGRCAGQKTSKLWQVASKRNVDLADPRPQGLVELSHGDERPETEEGVFGGCELFRPTTENGIFGDFKLVETSGQVGTVAQIGKRENGVQNIVGSAMAEMPIWYEPSAVDPGADEGDEGKDCYKLTDKEWELIQFLRQQADEKGIGGKDRAIDWMKLLPLILEIIRIIQEGRNAG